MEKKGFCIYGGTRSECDVQCEYCKEKDKTMESNKSKGVEELIADADFILMSLEDYTHGEDGNKITKVRGLLSKAINSLAHPQQSEATLTDHAISIGTPIQTKAAASEGVGQAAEGGMPKDANGVTVKIGDMVYGEGYIVFHDGWKVDRRPTVPVHIKDGVLYFGGLSAKSFPKFWIAPSEPAALKEFYCIGDKDNLFQCEEQCEDCKKGAALKKPQGSAPAVVITDGGIEALFKTYSVWASDCRNIKVVPFAGFTAALKEFASLLTNHKS